MDKKILVPLHSLRSIEIIDYFNYKPTFNSVFSRNNLPKIRDKAYVINLDDKKVKEHIGFHYFLTEIHQYTLILLEFNIFLKKYRAKSKINQLLTTSQHI